MRRASVIVSSQESLVYTLGSLCRLRYSNGASDKAAAGEEIFHSKETETQRTNTVIKTGDRVGLGYTFVWRDIARQNRMTGIEIKFENIDNIEISRLSQIIGLLSQIYAMCSSKSSTLFKFPQGSYMVTILRNLLEST